MSEGAAMSPAGCARSRERRRSRHKRCGHREVLMLRASVPTAKATQPTRQPYPPPPRLAPAPVALHSVDCRARHIG